MERYRYMWSISFANGQGRLAQVIRNTKSTNTIKFICKSEVTNLGKIIYSRLVCDRCCHCPQKEEKDRTKLTVSMGGYIGPST